MPGPRTLCVLLTLILPSCGPSATEGGMASPVPAARIAGIEQASRENDRSAIQQIVEMLASDDAAVRFAAIGALHQMTGETYGFHADDPPAQRREAIDRWVKAVESESVLVRVGPVASNRAREETQPGATRG